MQEIYQRRLGVAKPTCEGSGEQQGRGPALGCCGGRWHGAGSTGVIAGCSGATGGGHTGQTACHCPHLHII